MKKATLVLMFSCLFMLNHVPCFKSTHKKHETDVVHRRTVYPRDASSKPGALRFFLNHSMKIEIELFKNRMIKN